METNTSSNSKKRKTPSDNPSSTNNNINVPPTPTTQKWRCDICFKAVFDTYNEAFLHERGCAEKYKKAPRDAVSQQQPQHQQVIAVGGNVEDNNNNNKSSTVGLKKQLPNVVHNPTNNQP